MMNGTDHSWGIGSGYVWIIVIIVVLLGIWLVLKIMSRNSNRNAPMEKTPLDVLNDRYARGEISKQEYQEKKKAIS